MAKTSFIQKRFEWIYDTFKEDTSKMLIATGTLGWILSSFAQMCAITANPKISSEKKSFLLPQELMDAVVNVGGFFAITMLTKKCINKMASTGKIASKTVRNFLENDKDLKTKVGKLDLNLDNVLKEKAPTEIYENYKSYKNFVSTMGTIGASVISCNIVTPVIRNKTASRVQKTYIDMQQNPSAYPTPVPNLKI